MGEIPVTFMKAEKGFYGLEEIFNVLGLGLIPSSGIGVLAPGVALSGPLGFQFGTNPLDGRRRCPHAPGKDLPPLLLLNDPVIARSLHPAGQGGVTWGQENPALRCSQDTAIGGTDGVRGRAGGEGLAGHCASLRSHSWSLR